MSNVDPVIQCIASGSFPNVCIATVTPVVCDCASSQFWVHPPHFCFNILQVTTFLGTHRISTISAILQSLFHKNPCSGCEVILMESWSVCVIFSCIVLVY